MEISKCVMGIDPGLREGRHCGIGVVVGDRFFFSDTVGSQEDHWLDRIYHIRDQVEEWLESSILPTPDLVVIEKPVMGRHRNVKTFMRQCFLIGVLLGLFHDWNIPVKLLQWNQIYKRGLGHGGLSKEDALAELRQRLQQQEYELRTPNVGYDESDAIIAALAGLNE